MARIVAEAPRTVVMELDGLHWATQKNAVEAALGRRPGVLVVEANPTAQTATVSYDPQRTTVEDLAAWLRGCGYHCRGESVPDHVCPPGGTVSTESDGATSGAHSEHETPGGHEKPSTAGSADRMGNPADVMGHGGHGEMSMAAMVRDMRNRFVVAVAFGVVITLWSMIGREVLNFSIPAPFGLRDDVFQLVLSLPVIFYSAQVFFAGAIRAL